MALGLGPSPETLAMHGNRVGFGSTAARKTKIVDDGAVINREGVIKTVYFLSRMPCVDVELVRGGILKYLPFPGGKLDEITGFLHGEYIQPIVGQRVIVSFSEGDTNSPYISNLIWRPATGEFSTRYKAEFPLLWDEGDVIRGHKSGAYQVLKDFKIKTGFMSAIDPTGTGMIVQDFISGVTLSDAGLTMAHQEVACANINYVMTSLGPQPIQLASAIGPRVGIGTSVFA